MITIGKTVRLLRRTTDMSSGELALAANISKPFLSLLERGDRQPSLLVLRRIAEALHVPAETLIMLAMSDSTTLSSSDPHARGLAETINKMVEMEEALKKKLSKKGTREPQGPNAR